MAAAVNDLAALGVLPLVVNAYFAVGSTRWFANETRTKSLICGFRAACTDARAALGRRRDARAVGHRRRR